MAIRRLLKININEVKVGTKVIPKQGTVNPLYCCFRESETLTVKNIVNAYPDGRGFVRFVEYKGVENIANFEKAK